MDLNFKSNVIFDGYEAPEIPILCAAAKGDERMIGLILRNKTVDIDVKDT